MKVETTVLEVGGLHWATSEPIVERALARRPGVLGVEANALAQTANVTYDADQTSLAQLVGWVTECGYHCEGRSVPHHICEPMDDPASSRMTASSGDVALQHQAPGLLTGTTAMRARARCDRADVCSGRDGARRSPRRWLDGGHGARHAQPIPRRAAVVDPDSAVVADRSGAPRVLGRNPVRPA